MGFIADLWLPILLSAVGVFITSSIIHMLLPYHRKDFKQVPSEDEVQNALRPFNIPPGDYFLPNSCESGGMNTPEFKEKMNKGPVAIMTVFPNGPMNMGKSLALWFIYSIIVSFMAAYVSSNGLAPTAHYLDVFRISGCTAFIGYSVALLQNSIWYNRNWFSTFKSMFDGLLYSLVTGGVFGWLWAA